MIAMRGTITSRAVTIAIALTLAIAPLLPLLVLSSVLSSFCSFAVPSLITPAVSSALIVLIVPVTRLAFLLLPLSLVRFLAFLPRAVEFFFLRVPRALRAQHVRFPPLGSSLPPASVPFSAALV